MHSSTLFKVVIACVCAFSVLSFFNFNGSFSISSTIFDGEIVTKEFQLQDFHSIGLALPAHVKIKEGTSNTVKITAPEDVIDLINTEVKNGKWKIKLTKKMNWKSYKDIDIAVEMDDIRALSVGGSGEIETEDHFKNLNDVKCSIAGSGEITLHGDMNDLDASISGSGDFKLSGSGNDCDMSISGSGEFEAAEFEVKNVDISISGSGEAYLNVSETIDAAVSGSGDITYKGNAKVTSRISGSGSVSPAK